MTRFEHAIAELDQLHAGDPALEDGRPAELLYAERMTGWLVRRAPDASEALRLAVRAQHLCRWQLPRSDYPMDRAGYKAWRKEEGRLHAEIAGKTLARVGYADELVERVQFLIRKKKLKVDAETQTLEDVACLVFLQFYFEPFALKHSDKKLIAIVQKTWAKMSDGAQDAALGITLPDHLSRLMQQALAS